VTSHKGKLDHETAFLQNDCNRIVTRPHHKPAHQDRVRILLVTTVTNKCETCVLANRFEVSKIQLFKVAIYFLPRT